MCLHHSVFLIDAFFDVNDEVSKGGVSVAKRPRVTKKLIAEQLGLSMSTVDRALNSRGSVKPETQRRVIEAAEQLNYLVNRSARLLSRGDFNIAIGLPEYPEHFWGQVERGVLRAHAELRDYGLHVEIFRMSEDVQSNLNNIQMLMESNPVHAVGFVANDDAYTNFIDSATDHGVTVCTVNVDLPMSKRLFYVGCSYYNAGRMAGELITKLVRREGRVALVTDSWTTFQAQQKIMGFREVVSDHPRVRLVGPVKIDRDRLELSLEHLRTEVATVDAVYVSNAELNRVADLGLDPSIIVIGHDMDLVTKDNLDKGLITATICQEPEKQGYLSLKKLFSYVAFEEGTEDKENITKLEIVMRENANFYL